MNISRRAANAEVKKIYEKRRNDRDEIERKEKAEGIGILKGVQSVVLYVVNINEMTRVLCFIKIIMVMLS